MKYLKNPLRVNFDFRRDFKVIWVVQSPLAEIFRWSRRANKFYQLALSHPQEGRIMIVTKRGMGCGGRNGVGTQGDRRARSKLVSGSRRAGRTMLKRTAKPCGPGTRCWCQAAGGGSDPTGSFQPSSRQRR